MLVEIPIKINPMKQFQGFDKNEYKVEAPSLSLTQVIFMGLELFWHGMREQECDFYPHSTIEGKTRFCIPFISTLLLITAQVCFCKGELTEIAGRWERVGNLYEWLVFRLQSAESKCQVLQVVLGRIFPAKVMLRRSGEAYGREKL